MIENNKHFLEHPKVRHHLESIFPIIISESDRGAVLISASQVDLFLEEALKEIAPKNLSNKKIETIFNYSGALGTFSSRIDMAYFFRIIDKDVCQAIHALRGLRNDVAHNPKEFSLMANSDRISNLYELGQGIPVGLHQWSVELLMQSTIYNLLELKNPVSINDEPIFSEAKEVIEYIAKNPDKTKILDDCLPKYKLGLGAALICGIIFNGSNNAISILGDNSTFGGLVSKKNKDSEQV